jgi:prolyl-tRNA synthetase
VAGRNDTRLIVDPDAAQGGFWVTGANEPDHHVKYFNWKRDVAEQGVTRNVADIRNAAAGDPSPRNDGGILKTTKGIEIGHVFKLGDKYTKAMNVTILLPDNTRVHPIMGCYGIGVNRILASAIERAGGNDENGIIWPSSIAPFQVCITPIKYEGQAKEVADRIANELGRAKSPTAPLSFFHPDVIIDDRDERPGVKFKDADLVGFPVRVTLGEKTLANGQVEIKARTAAKPELVAIDQAAKRVLELLATL